MSSKKPFSRTVSDIGNGYPGVSIPKGLADQNDIEIGDEIEIRIDEDNNAVKYILD